MRWYDRLLGSIGLVRKEYRLIEKPTKLEHGASWTNAYGNKASYSQLGSLAAYSQHPYVFAAISRISEDLAATPLVLIKGKGKNATVVEDHPVIDLLQQPSLEVDGYDFLSQIILDLVSCGNCYILLLGLGEQPDSIVRLHPEQIEIITDKEGIGYYRYNADGSYFDYPKDRILHGKNSSWQTGAQGLYGVGAIQPIAEEIIADLNVGRLLSKASAKGRPDVILSPKTEMDVWDLDMRRSILDQYQGLAESGGALCVSGQIQVDFTQLTPRDIEFEAARKYSKEAITAALGVPESVLGGNSSTYATARQQAISYWTTLSKRGKRIAILLSKIAKLWDKDLKFEFDYSGVEALNSMRSDQLERIAKHIQNGMSAADAYAYEGLEDAPIVNLGDREPEAAEIGDQEEDSARAFFLQLARSTEDPEIKNETNIQPLINVLTEEIDQEQNRKLEIWNMWMKARVLPAQKMLEETSKVYLKASVKRYQRRIRKYVKSRAVLDFAELEALIAEKKEIKKSIGSTWGRVWKLVGTSELEKVFRLGKKEKPIDLFFEQEEIANEMIDQMATEIARTSGKSVRIAVDKGLAEGLSVSKIASTIGNITAFDEARAMLIARTESTRVVNAAAVASYQQGQEAGLDIRKQWLASQDGKTRETHNELGELPPIGVNEPWTLNSDEGFVSALSPATFGLASEDCNCRCTVIPIVV
jgi:HK97 family phage portal protein